MPPPLHDGAALPNPTPSPDMEQGKKSAGINQEAKDQRANLQPRDLGKEKINKQSMDYMIRSGLAGGLAGCVVRPPINFKCVDSFTYTSLPGKDRRGTPRPSENSVSSLQSCLRQIQWFMAGTDICYATNQPARWHPRTVQRTQRYSPPYLPLRRHQIPCLRAVSSGHNYKSYAGNTSSPPPVGLPCWSDVRILYVPTRNHSCAPRIRDAPRLKSKFEQNMSPDIQRTPTSPRHARYFCLLYWAGQSSGHADDRKGCPPIRPHKLLSWLFSDSCGHVAVCRNGLPYTRHSR